MNLVHYRPRALDLFDWNRIFERFFDDETGGVSVTPAVDIHEDDKGYKMEVELPGLTDKDIELNVEDNILTLSSQKEESKEEKKNGYLIRERRNREFARTFVLPKDVDRDKIKGEFKNGLLVVSIPKKPEAKPRKIDVKSN